MKYFLHLLLLSVCVFLACLSAQVVFFDQLTIGFADFVGLILFFSFSTALFHYLMSSSEKVSGQHFVRTFMMATVFKLLLFLLVLVGYLLLRRESALHFTLAFAGMYFIYTAFEVLKLSKPSQNKRP